MQRIVLEKLALSGAVFSTPARRYNVDIALSGAVFSSPARRYNVDIALSGAVFSSPASQLGDTMWIGRI